MCTAEGRTGQMCLCSPHVLVCMGAGDSRVLGLVTEGVQTFIGVH